MIRVIVADDHPVILQGVVRILQRASDIKIVGTAETGQEVIGLISKTECDVLLLDISMPGISGLETLKQIQSLAPGVRTIILSAHREEEYGIRSIKAGAFGYVRKISAPDELVDAIRKVYQGRKYISPKLAEELANALSGDNEKLPHQSLSDRELQVLLMISNGFTINEISENLALSPSTVATYRSRIIEKMNMRNDIELTKYVLKYQLDEI